MGGGGGDFPWSARVAKLQASTTNRLLKTYLLNLSVYARASLRDVRGWMSLSSASSSFCKVGLWTFINHSIRRVAMETFLFTSSMGLMYFYRWRMTKERARAVKNVISNNDWRKWIVWMQHLVASEVLPAVVDPSNIQSI